MIQLFIDGIEADLQDEQNIKLNVSEKNLNPEHITTQIFHLKIPTTKKNRSLMEFPEQTLSPKQFNQKKHSAKIISEGATLIHGEIEFVKSQVNKNGNGVYCINLIAEPPEWVRYAKEKSINEITIDFDDVFFETNIINSWTNDKPVKFLPVKYAGEKIMEPLRFLTYENYYPFIQIKALIYAIIQKTGYKISSKFINDDFFESLYMSGIYKKIPNIGEKLTFKTVCDHKEKQLKLIEAISQLFDLKFYTDELSKTVYIEPYADFNQAEDIDWTRKIDPNKEFILNEPGKNNSKIETYEYKNEDPIIKKWNQLFDIDFAAWQALVENRFAKTEEKKITNTLFSAAIDQKGALVNAPSASMIIVGEENDDKEYRNFAPKIVRFLGMKTLPREEAWVWPSFGLNYPQVMFQPYEENDKNMLSFNDSETGKGLNQYYKRKYNFINKGKILTLYLNLSPSEIEALQYPGSTLKDFRGNFLFNIRGEKIRGRLIEIEGYDPINQGSTKCSFAVEL